MAAIVGAILGPCFRDDALYDTLGVTYIAGGSGGSAGWLGYSGTTERAFIVDYADTSPGGTFDWFFCYFYSSGLGADGSYRQVQQITDTTVPAGKKVDLRFSKIAGNLKLELYNVTDSVSLATSTSNLAAETIYRICWKMDGTNWKIYVNGTLEITLARTTYPNGTTPRLVFRFGAASGNTGSDYWSSQMWFADSAASIDETHYPEVRGSTPDGNGNYQEWTSNAYTNWDDVTVAGGLNDGDTTYNEAQNANTKRCTSTVEDRTFSNTIYGALFLALMRANTASKNIPIKSMSRRAATDKEVGATITSMPATYASYQYLYTTPASGSWDTTSYNDSEWGLRRDADAASVFVTAIAVEGAALGATDTTPATPVVAVGQPMMHRRRQGSDWPAPSFAGIGRGR